MPCPRSDRTSRGGPAAAGCQVEIACTIVERGADYCLAAKGNQPTLQAGIEDFFEDHLNEDVARTPVRRHHTHDKGHGRDEQRTYYLCPVPDDLPDLARWPHLKAIGVAASQVDRGGKVCEEVRYDILGRYVSGQRFAEAVRGHWGVENRLHWPLDATFREDDCRVRKGHADARLAHVRRTAPSLPHNERTAKVGVKNTRLGAARNDDDLAKVVFRT